MVKERSKKIQRDLLVTDLKELSDKKGKSFYRVTYQEYFGGPGEPDYTLDVPKEAVEGAKIFDGCIISIRTIEFEGKKQKKIFVAGTSATSSF